MDYRFRSLEVKDCGSFCVLLSILKRYILLEPSLGGQMTDDANEFLKLFVEEAIELCEKKKRKTERKNLFSRYWTIPNEDR